MDDLRLIDRVDQLLAILDDALLDEPEPAAEATLTDGTEDLRRSTAAA
jgi:hypothetical protein